MREVLDEFHPTTSIGGQQISNLRFADDIDLMATTEAELQELTRRLELSDKKNLVWRSMQIRVKYW